MSRIQEIYKKSLCLNNQVERKLYCIKENNFIFNEEFKNILGFEFQVYCKYELNYYICLDGQKYCVGEESRIIDFIIEGESNKRFIYSLEYLKKVFYEFKIEYYSIKDEKLDNSLDSQISDEEILNIFTNTEIKSIYRIKSSFEKYLDKFRKRYSEKYKTISDISLNAEYYYPQNYKDNINLTIYKEYEKDFRQKLYSNNIIYLFGPKGTSKSIFLMNFCLLYNIRNNPTLYINYQVMKNLELKERKNIFKKEMVYLFFEETIFKSFYEYKYHKIIKKEICLLRALKTFVTDMMGVYKNTFKSKVTLIIDNFNENEKQIYDEMEELIKLVKDNKNKIRLILSGHSKFLNDKLKLFIENKSFKSTIDGQILMQFYLKLEGDEIKSLPAFNYKKNINPSELEETLLKEEVDYCKKFNVFGMHYSVINNGNNIKLEELKDYFDILPIDYLIFKINEDNSIIFNFHNKIYSKAVNNSIKVKMKETSLKVLLKEINEAQLIKGIYEEKLLTLLISYNKLYLNNMKTSENNLLEIKQIVDFKKNSVPTITNKIEEGKAIIITQELFNGQHYDLLVLISENDNDIIYYTAYMIQIGTNKIKKQIDTIKDDFEKYKKNYKNGIKTYIGNNIRLKDIQLVFIFDKNSQEKLKILKKANDAFGSKYCISQKIKFCLFSTIDYYLYKTCDLKNFYKIYEFGDFDASNKHGWDEYLFNQAKLNYYFLKEEEIIFINRTKKVDIHKKNYILQVDIKKLQDFSENTDNEIIYILKNVNKKYYIINNLVYNLENGIFQKINFGDIDKSDTFKIYMLIEKKENSPDFSLKRHK